MNRNLAAIAALFLAGSLSGSTATAAEKDRSARSDSKLEVALHYDFAIVDGSQIRDVAGKKHDGTLQNGVIVMGKRRPAVQFDGQGAVLVPGSADALSPAQRAFSVGALCRPAASNGVLIAMGTGRDGFSLYLQNSVPHFAIRSNGELASAAGETPVVLEQWTHLLGTVSRDGQMQLLVNGWPVAKVQGKLIAKAPEKPLCLGRDSGGPVGEYQGTLSWRGLLEDVRLYWGAVDRNEHRDELGDWADLPGCGCKK